MLFASTNPIRNRFKQLLCLYGRKHKGDDAVFKEGLEKIILPEDMTLLRRHKVLFSDLDIVGHVNNVKYIEWCLDQ